MTNTPKRTGETSRASRRTRDSPRQMVANIGSTLRTMARYMQSFQDIFFEVPTEERRHVMVPDTMIQAWLHLVIGLIHGSQGDLSWEEYLNVADGLVRKGMNETMLDLEAFSILFVRQDGYGKNGECLHISQLWCIILDNCKIRPFFCIRDVNADIGCLVYSPSHHLWQNVGIFSSG